MALLIWVIAGVTVAGMGVLAVVATPSLAAQSERLIPIVALGGFAIAFVVSWIVARRIRSEKRS
jgi:hypothetical protein